ncbi:BRO1-like domain-containing protein, partial [Blastocladiella britannica]
MLLLALPLRPGAPLSPPLSALLAPAILAEYGLDSSSSSSAAVLHRDLATLDHLRDAAVSLADPGLPAAAEPLSAYLAQLAPLTTRFFALDASSSRVPFSWRPALTATATAKRKPLVLADVAYERASLLFNLAAVYSTVAAASFTSSESVADLSDAASAAAKTACEFSRRAAGVIATLRSDLKASGIPHTSLPLDLQPATLTLLFHLHRAQAGECVWRTAAGAMSNGILTKIAASIADEYAAAVDAVKGTQIAESDLLKHWVNHLTAKHLLFAAHAAHRRASVDAERGLHGDCVARLRLALSLLQQRAAPILKYVNGAVVAQLRALEGVVAPAFTQALKDNDLVYVQPEPSPADLVQGPGIKPDKYGAGEMEFVLLPPATVLFAELLPLDAHRIATDYANRRDEAADALAHAATRSVANASAALRDSGVPGLLAAAQDAAAPPTNRAATPGSIVAGSPRAVAQDRAREFTVTMGGASAFELQIVNLGDLAARCGAMMDEILTVLDAEAADDLAKLQQFGGRWDRTPSTVLQRSMRDRIVELRRKANVARQSDGFIRDRYMRELEKLRLLESVHT